MATEIGFTQLGRRLSSLEKKERSRNALLSIVIVNFDSRMFALKCVENAFALVRALDGRGEVVIVDADASKERSEALLKQFPDLRLIVPTGSVSLSDCFFLSARESVAPRLLFLDSSVELESFVVDEALAAFDDSNLFALGFQRLDESGVQLPSVVKAFFDGGRVHMIEGNRGFQAASLFLKNFVGLYDREKILLLGDGESRLRGLWCEIDFFYGSWGRGWSTIVDPVNSFRTSFMAEPVNVGGRFRKRYRYYRDEIFFLRKNFVDKESRLYRRKLFYSYGLKRLLRFDASLFLACFVEFFQKFLPGRHVRKRSDAVYTPTQVFAKLMEGSS